MEYTEAIKCKALKKHTHAKKCTYLLYLAENERINLYSRNRKITFAQL